MAVKTYTHEEFCALISETYPGFVKAEGQGLHALTASERNDNITAGAINGALSVGQWVGLYRNADLSHPGVGTLVWRHSDSDEFSEELPSNEREINWRYRLEGVYGGKPVVPVALSDALTIAHKVFDGIGHDYVDSETVEAVDGQCIVSVQSGPWNGFYGLVRLHAYLPRRYNALGDVYWEHGPQGNLTYGKSENLGAAIVEIANAARAWKRAQ